MEPEREHASPTQNPLWPLALLGILAFVSGFAWPKVRPVDSQTKEANSNEGDAQTQEKSDPVATAEFGLPQTVPHRTSSHEKRRKVPDWLMFLVNILILLAVVWYACEARKQRVAMDNTLREAHRQTTLMQQQVEGAMAAIITKQFRITWPDRAYLSVILDNRGKVIGSNVRGDFQLTRISLPDQKASDTPTPWEFIIPEISPSDRPTERGIHLDMLQETAFHSFGGAIKLAGTFTYFNGFRNETDPICYYALGALEFRNKLGKIQQTIAPQVISCDELAAQLASYSQTSKDISQQ